MTLWILMALMCLGAILFVAIPLYRDKQGFSAPLVAAVVLVAAVSAGLYAYNGNPNTPSATGAVEAGMGMDDAIASLADRLANEPDDINGWQMLARSYLSVEQYAEAVDAFERVVELENSSNPQSLVSLGEAILSRDNTPIAGRAAALFESALALDPNNPQALFYTGIAASNVGNNELAAERWERLAGLNPPEEIRGILQQKIAEWRGLPAESVAPAASAPAASAPAAVAPAEAPPAPAGTIISINMSLADEAAAAISGNPGIFVIARDPNVPGPPIAVSRSRVSDLPTTVHLADGNSMVAGRSLSAFAEFEVLVRVSSTGQPMAVSGDWFGSAIVKPEDSGTVDIVINQQVP